MTAAAAAENPASLCAMQQKLAHTHVVWPAARASPERLAAARRVAAAARVGLPQLEGPQRVAHENPNFLSEFFGASRLHLIGSWKERFQKLIDSMPPPPELPPTPRGGERVIAHIDMECAIQRSNSWPSLLVPNVAWSMLGKPVASLPLSPFAAGPSLMAYQSP